MKKIKFNGLNEEIIYEKLPCGLDVYLWNNDKCHSFKISLNVNYGSIHTDFKIKDKEYHVPCGIAHYLEHVNFNIDDDTTAFDLFENLGSDINAFTTFEYTSYHITGTEDVVDNTNKLLNYLYTPYFKKKLIQKERGIILEEAKMGLDNPGIEMFYKNYECVMHNDKRRNKVIGTLEDIKKISLEDIKLIYNTFYHPENMFMIVTGNIDVYEVLAAIKENMGARKFPKYQKPEVLFTKEPSSVVTEECVFEGNTEIPKISVNIKISDTKIKPTVENNCLLSLILRSNFGVTSEFKNSLIEEKLVTSLGFEKFYADNNCYIKISAISKYPDVVVEKIKNKLNNLEITEQEFERKKKVSIAKLIFMFEDSEDVNYNIQDDIIYTKDHKIVNNIKEIYENLKYEEALKLLKKIDTKNIASVVMKPKTK